MHGYNDTWKFVQSEPQQPKAGTTWHFHNGRESPSAKGGGR